tara:strand:- start:592 stop:909 length:318 start_codon:yes stop_codon:yes gene_type:complete
MDISKDKVDSLIKKYPGKIPIIVDTRESDIVFVKNKYLIKGEVTVGLFMAIIRQYIKDLDDKKAIFIFFNNILFSNSAILNDIYKDNHEESGLLYATIAFENTFG